MLDMKIIREKKDVVLKAMRDKQVDIDLEEVVNLDRDARVLKNELQVLQTEKNEVAREVPKAPDKAPLIERGKQLNGEIAELKTKLDEVLDKLNPLLLQLPNIPADFAPIGASEEENKVLKTVGEIPQFDFAPKGHREIAENNGWIDFERTTRVCGERGYTLKGELAQVEFALHRMVQQKLIAKGFEFMIVPSFGRDEAFVGTGHFPKGEEQMYFMERDNLYLTGTAEIVTNSLYAGEILEEKDLPKLMAAYSPCFRREAGSAGKDVGGLMRVHQFAKTEQYILCKNDVEESHRWHTFMLEIAEEILSDLGLPYQVVECCTGDMGLGKFRMNDIETWIPFENRYRETHSCSTLFEWQARRTNLRYRDQNGEVQFCHTLNCTGIATPRVLIPLIEIHQTKEGKVNWPKCLQL